MRPITTIRLFPFLAILMLLGGSTLLAGGMNAAAAQETLPAFMKRVPSEKEIKDGYPESDAIALFDSIVVTLHDDGRISRRHHRAVLLLTDNAIRRYGDPRIPCNTASQELTFDRARVYMLSGRPVDTQANGFNLTTPFSLALAPDYVDWQEMVVTHVGIEKGCVAELDYTIRDTEVRFPWLSGAEYFGGPDPAIEHTLVISVPDGYDLNRLSANGAPEPESRAAGTYSFTMTDIPGRGAASGGVWRGDYQPAVYYSTAQSWNEVLRFISASVIEAVNGRGVLIEILVDDLSSNVRGEEELACKIHGAVLKRIRSVNPPCGLLAAAPRTAERIYESAYASPLDRFILLAAMFKEAGIKAFPVLLAPGYTFPGDVPVPEIFDRVLLEAYMGEEVRERVLIDPAAALSVPFRFILGGRTIARLDGGFSLQELPVFQWNRNKSSLDLTVELESDGVVKGEGLAVFKGALSPYYEIKGIGDETKKFLEGQLGGLFEEAELENWNVTKLGVAEVELGFRFKAVLPDEKEGRHYISIPGPLNTGICGIGNIHLERSYYPVPVAVLPCVLEVTCRFDKMSGFAFAVTPREADIENEAGRIRVQSGPGSDGEFVYIKKLMLKKGIVSEEEYGELRTLLLGYLENRAVLEKNN